MAFGGLNHGQGDVMAKDIKQMTRKELQDWLLGCRKTSNLGQLLEDSATVVESMYRAALADSSLITPYVFAMLGIRVLEDRLRFLENAENN